MASETIFGPEVTVNHAEAALARVAALIAVRDGNGKVTRKFCLLCKEARRLRVPCPHNEIWRLNGRSDDGDGAHD